MVFCYTQMSRRSRKKVVDFKSQYCNVFSGTRSEGKMSYWDVIDDMGDLVIEFPILNQIGGTCVPYSIQTAKVVATHKQLEPPEITSECKRKGTQMEKYLKKEKLINYTTAETKWDAKAYRRYYLLQDIKDALDKNCVVVAGGGPNVPTDVPYKYKRNNKTKNSKVPVFMRNKNRETEHNICIIGYYEDINYGNCFLTKMTNCRGKYVNNVDCIDTTGIPKEYKGLTPKELSYGILPLSALSETNSPLYLTEFAMLPVEWVPDAVKKPPSWYMKTEETIKKEKKKPRRSTRKRRRKVESNLVNEVMQLKF